MKVEIDTAALADAVAWTSRVIDARPSNPILAGVKLEAIDGTLQFSAFNYEISARHHIEAGVDEAGSVLVQGKLLADITKSLRSRERTWSPTAPTLTITSGKLEVHLAAHARHRVPGSARGTGHARPSRCPDFRSGREPGVRCRLPRRKPPGTDRRSHAIPRRQGRHDLHRSLPFGPRHLHLDAARTRTSTPPRWFAAPCSRMWPVLLDEHQNIRLDFDADSPTLLGFENAGRVSTSQLIDGEFPACF